MVPYAISFKLMEQISLIKGVKVIKKVD